MITRNTAIYNYAYAAVWQDFTYNVNYPKKHSMNPKSQNQLWQYGDNMYIHCHQWKKFHMLLDMYHKQPSKPNDPVMDSSSF